MQDDYDFCFGPFAINGFFKRFSKMVFLAKSMLISQLNLYNLLLGKSYTPLVLSDLV